MVSVYRVDRVFAEGTVCLWSGLSVYRMDRVFMEWTECLWSGRLSVDRVFMEWSVCRVDTADDLILLVTATCHGTLLWTLR